MGADIGSRRRQLRRGVWKATTGALNLSVAASAGLGAALLGSWPVAALGGAAYAALVAWDLSSAKFWARVVGQGDRRPPATLPAPGKVASPELRANLEEILAARHELATVVESTPPQVLGHLHGTLAAVGELERRAAELLTRGDSLARYLAGAGLDDVRRAVEGLRHKLQATQDREARAHYQSALEARQQHLLALEEIASATGRLQAHLTRLAALLSSLPPKIVQLRALDAETLDRMSGDMSHELESFTLETASFEETLRTLAEVPVAGRIS
jgi:hypothetical protein